MWLGDARILFCLENHCSFNQCQTTTEVSCFLTSIISSNCWNRIPTKMQCFRSNNNRSPPEPQSLSMRSVSLSNDSLNKYFSKSINRKSFVRRSFEIVRKNVLRQSQYVLRRNSVKVRKLFKRSEDPNNNRSSYDDSRFTNQHYSNTHCTDDDGGGGGDSFVTSTDADILTSNANSRGQYCSNVRWVFK